VGRVEKVTEVMELIKGVIQLVSYSVFSSQFFLAFRLRWRLGEQPPKKRSAKGGPMMV
jgi:hypothetical protein